MTADNAMADNMVYCIIGYPAVQYTTLHYWIMSFLEKCKLMVWVVLTMIKGCPWTIDNSERGNIPKGVNGAPL